MAARQVPAASRASWLLSSTCINFSASKNVVAETSGPTGGEVANAEGAPGGALDGAPLCAAAPSYAPMAAPTTPRDALVKKRLREFFNGSPYSSPAILGYLAGKGSTMLLHERSTSDARSRYLRCMLIKISVGIV
jgi:hypothetical protein